MNAIALMLPIKWHDRLGFLTRLSTAQLLMLRAAIKEALETQ